MNDQSYEDPIIHCISRIVELTALDDPDRRSLLQLGYNLGRLSELTGQGRAPFWDRWKGPVASWDRPALRTLAHELHQSIQADRAARPPSPDHPREPR